MSNIFKFVHVRPDVRTSHHDPKILKNPHFGELAMIFFELLFVFENEVLLFCV